jgi:hypothetical protein
VTDPRLINPNFKLCQSNICHPALVQGLTQRAAKPLVKSVATVASIQHQSDDQDWALLDSGATDSVSNDVSLFVSLWLTLMNLIVVSTDWFPVKQLSNLVLSTPQGLLCVS